jgi:DNA-directed RNA polymerase beta subunit
MDMTFAAPLHLKVALVNNTSGEATTQEVYMGDFPLMTEHGTFVINGAERVVVSQLIRSPGVYFTAAEDRATGRVLCAAKLIPNRGAWLEFETSKRDVVSVKVDRKRKIPVTMLLKAVGVGDASSHGEQVLYGHGRFSFFYGAVSVHHSQMLVFRDELGYRGLGRELVLIPQFHDCRCGNHFCHGEHE